VVSVLAVGLGIAVAIMAFAPVAPTSSPGATMVGIHEANYDVEGGEASPFKFYFRVHTGVLLLNENARNLIEGILTCGYTSCEEAKPSYEELEKYIENNYEGQIPDPRARGILDLIGEPWDEDDSHTLSFRLDRQCGGITWYCFHVFMDFQINHGQATAIRKHLDGQRWQPIRSILKDTLGVSGKRPEGICKQVRAREDDELEQC
jgi:hypothetical protein